MILKNEKQYKQYKEIASIHRDIIAQITPMLTEGTTGNQINKKVGELCKKYGVEPAFKGVYDFPANLCVSVNDCVVHGLPTDIPFHKGDVVKIDFGVKNYGLNTDAAFTVQIGGETPEMAKYFQNAREALRLGLEQARVGNRVGDVGSAIEKHVEEVGGYHIIRTLTGHGLGTSLHEKPYIYNYGVPGKGARFEENMVVAIEPIVGYTCWDIYEDDDGWSLCMEDGNIGIQFEHCLIIRKDWPEILV